MIFLITLPLFIATFRNQLEDNGINEKKNLARPLSKQSPNL
jgi:hypothetical protein